jgi:hypothetical protein
LRSGADVHGIHNPYDDDEISSERSEDVMRHGENPERPAPIEV